MKPPRFFWWVNLLLARSLFILVVSLTMHNDSDFILSFFYPQREQFLIGVTIGLGPLLAISIASFRDKWLDSGWRWLAKLIKPLLFMALMSDIFHQILLATKQHWTFNGSVALFLFLDLVCFYWLLRSRHLSMMVKDWGQ